MKLIDMKLAPEEAKEQASPAEMPAEQYPYGLCLELDDGTLKKLGIEELPKPGTEMTVQARARVVGAHQSADEGGEEKVARLQIIALGVQADAGARTPGQRVYGD
jgi:hypothetical protein